MSEQTTRGLPISTIFLISMAPRPIPKISKPVLIDRANHFITNMFVTYRLNTLHLPLSWLCQQLGIPGQDRADILELRGYLKDECGLEPSYAVTRNRIPVAWDEDDKTVLYLTEGCGRPYTFKAADWLNEELMAEYGPAFQAAA